MSTPIVTGLAALIRSYYPGLTAVQVKKVIERSVLKPADTVPSIRPGSKNENISFHLLSRTGGIINAFNAVEDADTVKPSLVSKEPVKNNASKTAITSFKSKF